MLGVLVSFTSRVESGSRATSLMSISAEAVAKAVVLLLLQAASFIANLYKHTASLPQRPPSTVSVLVAFLNLAIQDWGPTCVSSCSSYLLSSPAELFLFPTCPRKNMTSAAVSCRKREMQDRGKQWSCCTKQGEIPHAYGKARDDNMVCTCVLPFHPAVSTCSKSLGAVVWVRYWLLGWGLGRWQWGHEG